MNISLIIAGGKGMRMHSELPKQFISVHDKPVIVYTLEAFQKHPNIDAIYISCLEGWDNVLHAYARQFKIDKLKKIVKGGDVGQESICNGIFAIAENHDANDVVLIHDSIRPLVSSDIISDCIVTCQQYGNAITTIPCAEAMLVSEDGQSSQTVFDRDCLKRTQTPQAFRLGDILDAHKEACARGIGNSVASCTLFVELGRPVFFSKGSEKNIKITTQDDLDIFKALLSWRT